MNVALWAEIRRLAEIEKLSGWAISRRLHCSRHTVAAALKLDQPPVRQVARRASLLDPYMAKIDALLAKYPDLSAVRIREEIARGPDGYHRQRDRHSPLPADGPSRTRPRLPGSPLRAGPGDAGRLGRMRPRASRRHDPQGLGVRGRALLQPVDVHRVHALAAQGRVLPRPGQRPEFFGGSPRALIFDNLKAAVLNGSGRAACFHPEFLALCGYFCLQPIACERRDPESKGIVEGGVRYVKHNALAGRGEELTRFEDYLALAPCWRDQVANVRMHETTRERPIDRFEQERSLLRPLPAIPFDTDEVVPAVVSPHARIEFDGNRYSTPPQFVRRPVTIRASRDELRVLHEGQVVAQHVRSYERGQLIVLPDHRLAALALRQRSRSTALEQEFDALGPEARQFHLHLNSQPVKTGVHLRRLLGLAQLYGRDRGAGRHRPGLGAGDLRRRLCREPAAGRTPAATTPHAHSAHSPAPRTDRRHRTGTRRPRPLRPLLQRHRGGLPWHDVTTISRHGWTATWPN